MEIIYSDDNNRLTPEIRGLMEQALETAILTECPELFDGNGRQPSDCRAEAGVTVTDGEEIRELNRDYRGIDRVTDVLSFPQFDDPDELAGELADALEDDQVTVLLGDVVLCYDRACEQAEEYGTGTTRELVYLFTHSILHLLGYDHMEEDERREMRSREEEILNRIGVSR